MQFVNAMNRPADPAKVGPEGRSHSTARWSVFALLRSPSRRVAALLAIVVAVAYFCAGRLGWELSSYRGVATVWPAAGVGVAAVLLGGRRMLWGIAAGALAVSLSVGATLPTALLFASARTLEALLAFELLRRVSFRDTLRRPGDLIAYAGLAAVIATALAAVVGALSVLVSGNIDAGRLVAAWRDWWIADLSAVLVVGTVVLVLSRARLSALGTRAAGEVIVMSAVVGLASYLLLRNPGTLPYLVLPMLFVLAFLYGQRGAVVGTGIVSTIAVVLAARGHGPFAGGALDISVIRAEIFVSVGSVTALLVAASQSERQMAEQAADRLAVSESALAQAQQLAHVGSFDTDLQLGRTVWSRELYRILGRDPRSFPPGWQAWRSCIHEEDRLRVEHAFRRAYARRLPTSMVHRVVRPDGQVRTVEAHFRFECDSDERPIRIVGTCQDITARKLAEERFRSLFEDAPYPILVFDGSGTIQLSNLRAQTLFGWAELELAGRQVEDLVLTPGGSDAPWYQTAAHDSGSREVELKARRRDGAELAVAVSLTPLVAEEGVLVSAAVRDITEVRAAAETLNFQARHDALTGLPNRLMFLEQLDRALARARRSHRQVAVVFLDLDGFKLVNDTHGHDVGDAVLTELTPRLNAAVRHGDTVARLGGDEFVVLCEDLPDETQALDIAERVVAATREPIPAAGYEHTISLSAGVVMVRDPEKVSAHGVLRDADAAMYSAKGGGKGRVAVFDESMRERLMERIAVEASLRGARSRGELVLVYQPVVALDDNRVVAVEALLRWQHPLRGLLAPAEFMQVAESTGLIADIGEWVIEEACRQAAIWRDAAGLERAVPVSVNISAHQLTRTDLAGAVARILRHTRLQPRLLMLEVTEGALLADMQLSRRELTRLKALGVHLVVDDFGTGYSSLPALRDLMIDGLKLDRSFVAALAGEDDDGSMVGAVLSMATALDAQVTAEGVETWAQVSRLRRHGCDFAQGFLFARPGPASDLTPLLIGSGQRDGSTNRS